ERTNLLTICKLVIKKILSSSLNPSIPFDNDHPLLKQFLIIMEHIFYNRLREVKVFLREKKSAWSAIEQLAGESTDLNEVVISIKEMNDIRSPLGRLRGWLRLALMQKKLSEYFVLLLQHKDDLLRDIYDEDSLMMCEDALQLSGLLVGLNCLDCTFVVKQCNLDDEVGSVFHLSNRDANDADKQIVASLLSQKQYMEEVNRNQRSTIDNLNQKLEVLSSSNILLNEEMNDAKCNIIKLQEENTRLKHQVVLDLENHSNQMKNVENDMEIERKTYLQSQMGLDQLYLDAQKNFNEEVHLRLEIEKELSHQISLKQEMEVGMKLLETDVHKKQDLIVSLRKQLEDIKSINVKLSDDNKELESMHTHKVDMLTKLEFKCSQMCSAIKDLENEMEAQKSNKVHSVETMKQYEQQIYEHENLKLSLETSLKNEKDHNAMLVRTLEEERKKMVEVQMQLQFMNKIKQENESLKIKLKELEVRCMEQEDALTELGSHLIHTKLKVENMKEEQLVTKDAQWADDKEITNCTQCQKQFSVSRRKHHCRNCGEIFCNDCSNTKMPLPSYAKPVRVCDACCTKLLKKSCTS
ncbi:hypothetical protein HELRODRAFT_80894, partial [Helobdella robusta]|uniref:FYVE-type domain-containing protein n=1 Tax=Helobdella robusta TaxID=6412 RepID=T1G469_HELRO